MLLTALVVLFLGLSDVEAKKRPAPRLPSNETIYRNALKVLQKGSVIGLAVISHEISDKTCDCLRSRFWKNISGGAERSLECYAKRSRAPGEKLEILKTNITVKVFLDEDMKYPVLRAYNDKGTLPKDWDNYYPVMFATPNCFVLRTVSSKYENKETCVAISEYKAPKNCISYFIKNCQRGVLHDEGHCALLDNQWKLTNRKVSHQEAK